MTVEQSTSRNIEANKNPQQIYLNKNNQKWGCGKADENLTDTLTLTKITNSRVIDQKDNDHPKVVETNNDQNWKSI